MRQGVGEPGQPGAEADPGEDVLEFGVGGGAPAHAEVLRQGRVEEVGALLDQPDHAPHVVRGKALQGHPVERCLTRIGREETHQHIGQRRLAGAARADQGHAAPGSQLQVHAAQRGAAGAGVGGPDPAQGERVRAVAQHDRGCRIVDHRRRVHGLEHPGRCHPRTLEGLGGCGQRRDQLERGQRDEHQDGKEGAVERAAVGRVDPERQGAPAGQPGQGRRQSEADAGGACPVPGHPAQAAVRVVDAGQLAADRTHHEQLGRALHEIDHARRELAPHDGLPGLLAARQASGQPREGRRREEEGDEEDDAGLGEEPPEDRHGARPDERRHQEGLQHP